VKPRVIEIIESRFQEKIRKPCLCNEAERVELGKRRGLAVYNIGGYLVSSRRKSLTRTSQAGGRSQG
jgi:hypothetical protein